MIEDLLKMAMMSQMKEEDQFESRVEACEELNKFINMPKPEIKVGEFVERTEMGMKRYQIPSGNMAAICTKLMPEAEVDPSCGDINDMVITIALAKNRFVTYMVDSRFYRVAGSKKSNVTQFGRRDLN